MKISLPIYIVALVAGLVYAALKSYYPELPLTEEQVLYIIVFILAALNVDVTQALKKQGLLPS